MGHEINLLSQPVWRSGKRDRGGRKEKKTEEEEEEKEEGNWGREEREKK